MLLRTLFISACAAVAAAATEDVAPAQGSQQITAGPIQVELSLDRTSMNAAQSLVATLRVTSPGSVQIDMPQPAEKLDGFAVAATADEPTRAEMVNKELRTVSTRRYTLDPFLPGDYTLPAMEVRWRRTGSGESGVARTAPVTVHVVSLLPQGTRAAEEANQLDPGSILEAYSPPQLRRWNPAVIGAAAGLGVVLLAGGTAYVMRSRRRGVDVLDAWLARLEGMRAAGSNGVDMCHHLADAVRDGLAERVDPAARTWASGELAERLPRGPMFSEGQAREVQQLLTDLDAIRFSGEPASEPTAAALLERTMQMMNGLRGLARKSAEVRA